jgi:type IV secretion system protein VirB10
MIEDSSLAADNAGAMPTVARSASPWPMRAGVAGVLLLGGATFYGLNSARTAPDPTGLPIAAQAPSTSADLPPPPVLAPVMPPPVAMPVIMPAPVIAEPVPPPPAPLVRPAGSTTPALVIDLSLDAKPPAAPGEADAKAAAAGDKLNSNEAFAARVNRTAPDTVGTERLSSTDLVVPQGTIITGVLETAINSDLPGLVRAVVSRDVRGFDGSRILIPRGSRLVGQYSNGVALGQSRAFVIWTRLLRSDGVSVQLGSAATDPLGTAGLGGKVNSHFLRRFGAATLLSVITSGLDLLINRNNGGTNVLVGSPTQANQLAGIALQREIDIPPTIKVPQGTPVRVFVARDLDFDPARAVRP